jgi:hypothetical protein
MYIKIYDSTHAYSFGAYPYDSEDPLWSYNEETGVYLYWYESGGVIYTYSYNTNSGYWTVCLPTNKTPDINGYWLEADLSSDEDWDIKTRYPRLWRTVDFWDTGDLVNFGTYEIVLHYLKTTTEYTNWPTATYDRRAYLDYNVIIYAANQPLGPTVSWQTAISSDDYYCIAGSDEANFTKKTNVDASVPYTVRFYMSEGTVSNFNWWGWCQQLRMEHSYYGNCKGCQNRVPSTLGAPGWFDNQLTKLAQFCISYSVLVSLTEFYFNATDYGNYTMNYSSSSTLSSSDRKSVV